MDIQLDEQAKERIAQHLDKNKRVLLTFEDGVGRYSQHAMIHMQVQFSINIIDDTMPMEGYDAVIHTNLVDFYAKGDSVDYLEEHMTLKQNARLNQLILAGDGGAIDENVSFIDFTK